MTTDLRSARDEAERYKTRYELAENHRQELLLKPRDSAGAARVSAEFQRLRDIIEGVASPPSEELERLRKRIEEVEAQKVQADEERDRLEANRAQTASSLLAERKKTQAASAEILLLEAQVDALSIQVQEASAEIHRLNTELGVAKEKAERLQEQLEQATKVLIFCLFVCVGSASSQSIFSQANQAFEKILNEGKQATEALQQRWKEKWNLTVPVKVISAEISCKDCLLPDSLLTPHSLSYFSSCLGLG